MIIPRPAMGTYRVVQKADTRLVCRVCAFFDHRVQHSPVYFYSCYNCYLLSASLPFHQVWSRFTPVTDTVVLAPDTAFWPVEKPYDRNVCGFDIGVFCGNGEDGPKPPTPEVLVLRILYTSKVGHITPEYVIPGQKK